MNQIQQLIIDNLNVWISARRENYSGRGKPGNDYNNIYGIKKLRALILDLAYTSKLVSNCEQKTSSILKKLENENENNKLIKKGLVRKKKSLLTISENEKLYSLPHQWEWIRLGNTGNIFNGNSINKNVKESKYKNLSSGRPYISTKDVGYGRDKLNYNNGILIPTTENKFKIAHKNSVLICSEGGSAGKKIGITDLDICFGNKLFANEVFLGVNPRFIFYFYQSQIFFNQFLKVMTGIIGGVSLQRFNNILVPIAAEKQQDKIVRKIDELFALCDQIEKQYTNSQDVHKKLVKVFLDILTQSKDLKEFKKNWQRIADHFDTLFTSEESIDELKKTLLQLAIMGKLVPQDPNDEPPSKFLKRIVLEVSKGKRVKEIKSSSSINDNNASFKLPRGWISSSLGDVLAFEYGKNLPKSKRSNSGEYLVYGSNGVVGSHNKPHVNSKCIVIGRKGSAGALNLSLDDSCCVTDVAYFCIPPSYFDLNFIFYLLKTLGLDGLGKGIKPGLNRNEAYKLIIAIPPKDEQKRIVAKLDELFLICDELKSRIQQARENQKQIADVLVSNALN